MYFSKLLFLASTVFGVLCFDSKGKFSRLRALYALLLASTRFPWYLIDPEGPNSLPLVNVMRILTQIFHTGIIISHTYQSFRHREVFERVFEVISRNYEVASTKIETAIFVLLGCSFAFCAYCRWRMHLHMNPYAFFVAGASEALMVIQFCSICHSTIEKHDSVSIDRLNKRLNQHLTRVHFLKQSNTAYGLQILFVFIQLITFIIFLCYRYVMRCWGGSNLCSSNYSNFIETIMATKCVVAFYLIVCCEVAENQVTDFHFYLSKLMRDNPHLYSNKKLSLILSMDETVQFTAFGFFRLRYPLVTSVMAATSTYIAVIFQLSQKDDPKCALQSVCKIETTSNETRWP